jgi:hypothetical protein
VPSPWQNVSGQKAAPAKTVVVKAAQYKLTSGAKTMPGASVPPKAVASLAASVSKVDVTVTSPRAGVLKISIGMKRRGAAPSLAMKGKQARLDAGPPLTSTTPLEVSARPRIAAEPDDDRVAYYAILDFVPSESSSSSPSETSG